MNVLIVDDEALVRTSVKLYLEKSGVDSDNIFQAENAGMMLKILEHQNIDVVFVDIRMPGTDGLSAIETAFSDDLHFYVLTGYEKFEYAQRALRLHVEDYLLKPVHPETISEIIKKEFNRLKNKHSQKRTACLEALERQINKRSGPSVPVPYGLALLSPSNTLLSCRNIAAKAMTVSFLAWEYYIFSEQDSFEAFVEQLEKEGCYRVLIYQKDTTLQSLQAAAWQALLFEPHCSDDAEELNRERTTMASCFARMVYWSQKDDFEQFGLVSTHFVKAIASSQFVTSDKAKERIVEALNWFFSDGAFHAVQLEDAARLLQFYAANVLLHTYPSENILLQLKAYIDAHYAQKITLSQLAEDFGYTPNYISSAFKKRFGDSPIQYLNHVRLQKACELLVQTSGSVQEIAQAVGFSDANYFSRLFSRQFCLSPATYRRGKSKG